MSESIVVKSCASTEEAEFLKSLLESNDIHAMVSGDNYAGVPLPTSNGVDLLVLKEDVDAASEILDKAQQGE